MTGLNKNGFYYLKMSACMKIGISMLDVKNIKKSPKFKKYACLSVIALCLVGYAGYSFYKTEPVSYMSVSALNNLHDRTYHT